MSFPIPPQYEGFLNPYNDIITPFASLPNPVVWNRVVEMHKVMSEHKECGLCIMGWEFKSVNKQIMKFQPKTHCLAGFIHQQLSTGLQPYFLAQCVLEMTVQIAVLFILNPPYDYFNSKSCCECCRVIAQHLMLFVLPV